ncbi:Fic family protein [Actinokineospora sp. 24-640]
MLFEPRLDDDDHKVIAEIDDAREQLRHQLRAPRRWKGQLRRNLKARAIQGSNSIEGYEVSLDDAIALMEDEEPQDADHRTSLEIIGYRNALTYVQELANDPHFRLDETLLRSLHFMMLGHDLAKSPGRYRQNVTYVLDEETGEIVYEGPDHSLLEDLMAGLIDDLRGADGCPPYVRAAMAHLNLVMIHPFRDGNGRMARALQTLVLAREQVITPEFSSIEEWLGRNTAAYYAVLAEVGKGAWNPSAETGAWVRFNLAAHHMQAQTVLRRVGDASRLWGEIDRITLRHGFHERVGYALYDAMVGLRVRRASYARQAELETGAAGRDLRALVTAGLLAPRGETKGRSYAASAELRAVRDRVAQDKRALINPYTGTAQSVTELRAWASGR